MTGRADQPQGHKAPPLGGAPQGPLKGVRVVDLTINVLGPLAAQILGDMGADVIKVEPPSGDPNRQNGPTHTDSMATMYITMNRNKRSVTLDLKRAEARDALMKLVESADVFLHSMRPGAAERLGIAYKDIAARNPNIVYAYAPGFRADGPNRDKPAFDDVIQGECGIAGLINRASGEPRYVPTVIVDKFCGYVLASSVAMALYAREKTGEGQEVIVPMFENMVAFNLVEHLWGAAFDPPLADIGYIRMFSPHRRPLPTQDGYICLLAVNDEQWNRLFPAIGRPELAQDERYNKVAARMRNINELYAIVAEQIAQRSTAEWHERLDAADIPNGPVKSLDDLLHDPYLNQTGFFRRYDHPTEGQMVTTEIPVQYSKTPGAIRLPPPKVGEHNSEVFAQLGFTPEQIESATR